MKLKFSLLIILFFSSGLIIGQSILKEYKYIIVPDKYDFLKHEDQYQLNSLTKFLFQKEGFETLFDKDKRPKDLSNNPCLALTSRVKEKSSMLSTKLFIELVNCKNEIVIASVEGKTRVKDFKKAYHEALRNAFKSITELNYSYEPSKEMVKPDTQVEEEKVVVVPFKLLEDIKKVEETDDVKKIVAVNNQDKVIVSIEEQEVEEIKNEVAVKEFSELKVSSNLLYAQPNDLGYQLVNSTPEVVYLLLRSSREEVFILKNKNGILYKKDNQWIAEFYEGNNLIRKELQIKF